MRKTAKYTTTNKNNFNVFWIVANRKSDQLRISEIFEELKNDRVKMRILEVMVKENRPMSAEEIAQRAGCSVFEVEKILTGTAEN